MFLWFIIGDAPEMGGPSSFPDIPCGEQMYWNSFWIWFDMKQIVL